MQDQVDEAQFFTSSPQYNAQGSIPYATPPWTMESQMMNTFTDPDTMNQVDQGTVEEIAGIFSSTLELSASTFGYSQGLLISP